MISLRALALFFIAIGFGGAALVWWQSAPAVMVGAGDAVWLAGVGGLLVFLCWGLG